MPRVSHPLAIRSVSIGILFALGVATAATAQETITVATDLGINGRHAYFFVAREKGYYAKEGLNIEIRRGKGSLDTIKQVAAGSAQFGVADAGAVIVARGNDAIPVKILAPVYAKFPSAIFVLKESGIAKPKDLEGKTLAEPPASSGTLFFQMFAKAAGFDASKVKWISVSPETLPAVLATKRADGIVQFVISAPMLRKLAAPKEILALSFADAGIDAYANSLITSESIATTKPDLVRRFVRATLQGLRDAIDDPQKAGEILNKAHPEVDVDLGRDEMKIVGELATLPGSKLGQILPERMQKTVDVTNQAFKLKQQVTPESAYVAGLVQ